MDFQQHKRSVNCSKYSCMEFTPICFEERLPFQEQLGGIFLEGTLQNLTIVSETLQHIPKNMQSSGNVCSVHSFPVVFPPFSHSEASPIGLWYSLFQCLLACCCEALPCSAPSYSAKKTAPAPCFCSADLIHAAMISYCAQVLGRSGDAHFIVGTV